MTEAGRPGRPRNPDIEDRVFDAAIDIYGRVGWAGFNFEVVTRATGIGKAAIYRRWPTREDLLAATLSARWGTVNDIDTGTLRGDLLCLVSYFSERLTGSFGAVSVHINADRLHFPEARQATDAFIADEIRAGRQIVRRAMARGELPEHTRPSLVIDLVVGGMQNHVLTTPPSLRAEMEASIKEFGEDLVDTVLRGVSTGSGTVSDAQQPRSR
jgi:AcrR family transcriptional regulator